MTLGRSAGGKTCDSCRNEYVGPAYATYQRDDCPVVVRRASHRCTENVCPDCAHARGIRPDRKDDDR